LTELREVSQAVDRSLVRWEIDRDPAAAMRWHVTYRAAAMIFDECGQYLLEYEQACGDDFEGADMQGTAAAQLSHTYVVGAANELGLRLREGRFLEV
jgi:hypothetical protein